MNRRIVFALLLTAAAGLAQELPDSGDAHVNSLYPNVNFGALPFLQVGGTTRAFVKFDLSGVATGSTPSSVSLATLVLWVGRVANAGGSGVAAEPAIGSRVRLVRRTAGAGHGCIF